MESPLLSSENKQEGKKREKRGRHVDRGNNSALKQGQGGKLSLAPDAAMRNQSKEFWENTGTKLLFSVVEIKFKLRVE